ncbi:MAG TPA: GlxA family transcriptional regulator [Xanthomonadaceae bacterium]|jgi:transcriptional regulator GlxA family with amidase domain
MKRQPRTIATPPGKESTTPHRVVMFAYPDAQILDVTGPLEVFGRAARWLRDKGIARGLAYTVEVVATEPGPFATSSGVRLVAERAWRDVKQADTLFVTGGIGYRKVIEDEAALAWIRTMAGKVQRLGSICTGALVLARTGLLEGKSATTHWAYCNELAKAAARTRVDPDAIFVRNGKLYTSAGVTAGMDMALAMVEEDWGQAAALGVARELVLFLKRPGGQSQFSNQLAAQFSDDDPIRELQLWMLERLDKDLSIPRLAARVAMSERNFARRFTESVGMAPGQYVTRIRVDAARRKLEESAVPISQIVRRCGFGTLESLRRAFAAHVGVAPSSYRERFRREGSGGG